jgi:hypothetical protein
MKIKLILLTLLTCLTFNSFSQINRFSFRNDSVYLDSITNIGYLLVVPNVALPQLDYCLVLNFKTKKSSYEILGKYILDEYIKYNKSITNIYYSYRYNDKSITVYLTEKEVIYITSKYLKEAGNKKLLSKSLTLGGGIIASIIPLYPVTAFVGGGLILTGYIIDVISDFKLRKSGQILEEYTYTR